MNVIQNHNYIQLVWKATPEIQDIIIGITADLPFESFEQKENFLYAYIPAETFDEIALRNALSQYDMIGHIPYTIEQIPAQNWNAVWEANFPPVSLYPDVLVRATHHSNNEDSRYHHVIQIQPKMAFGTGHHETTQMMLQAMKEIEFKDKSVLDVGCGSGILSVYASFLGAKSITAIDIDTWCIENTIENATLNTIKNIEVHLGDINTLTLTEYEVILANINRNIIISQMEVYKNSLSSGGYLIVSGFLDTDVDIVQNHAKNLNFNMIHKMKLKDWACVTLQKTNQ